MEKTTQLTPGPWAVEPYLTPESDSDPMGVYVVSPAADQLEKAMEQVEIEENETGEYDDGTKFEAVHDINRANARLIAAAPELLEACKMLLEEAVAFGFDSCNVNCVAMARDAIAKATKS